MTRISTTYGSLDEGGWVTDSNTLLDKLFSDFLLSNYTQTYLYIGNVKSFSWLLETYLKKPVELQENIKTVLTSYLRRYFEKVVVETGYRNEKDSSFVELSIYVNCIDNYGRSINLGKILTTEGSVLKKVADLNNDTEI